MIGGLGNDIYYLDDSGDVVSETSTLATEIDTVNSSVSYTLGANLENLNLIGTDDINATGNSKINTITGNIGNNILNGGTGADSLVGGLGDDTYIVDNIADTITENLNGGIDIVNSSVTYKLNDNIENLTLIGNLAINGTGNASDNYLTGNAGTNKLYGFDGNDILDGLAGADSLYGGAGDDTLTGGLGIDSMSGGTGDDIYYVDTISDVIFENTEEGVDTVYSGVSYAITNVNVENLTLTGIANINGTGNASANTIYGNAGNNSINGGAGNDYLDSGYNFDNFEMDYGNNILDGGLGADVMIGGYGNDTYYVDDSNDSVQDYGGDLNVLYSTATDFTLDDWSGIQKIVLSGTANINITADCYDNTIIGNAGNNIIDGSDGSDSIDGGAGNDSLVGGYGNDTLTGGLGIDTMIGGYGDDIYYVDTISDVVSEIDGDGIDIVNTSVSYTITDDNVENIILTGTGAYIIGGNASGNYLTGNAAANKLYGFDGNDILDGLAGNDSLYGGAGDDTLTGGLGIDSMSGGTGDDIYYIDTISDVIFENAEEGVDTVYSGITYAITNVNVENLILTGTANINGTGNASDNYICGNAGNNSLNGGAGNDYLESGYNFDNSDIDNGNNTLDGGIGADTMYGGYGNDAYYVDNSNDYVYDNGGDLNVVYSTATDFTLDDWSGIQKIVLSGTANINITADCYDNTIIGNAGNNIISGRVGNDTMQGAAGNDTYLFNIGDNLDTIIDTAGTDLIKLQSNGNIAIFKDSTNKLQIDYGDYCGNDRVTVNSWSTTASQIEKVQRADNTFVTNADITKILQDMTVVVE